MNALLAYFLLSQIIGRSPAPIHLAHKDNFDAVELAL
jgi:hypothetical protein